MGDALPSVVDLLAEGFSLGDPATPAEIALAEASLSLASPPDLREFLLAANGCEGAFPGSGEPLSVYALDEMLLYNTDEFRDSFPGLIAIGGNCGLEIYALELVQGGGIAGMVAIDPIDPESALPVARTFSDAIRVLADRA